MPYNVTQFTCITHYKVIADHLASYACVLIHIGHVYIIFILAYIW